MTAGSDNTSEYDWDLSEEDVHELLVAADLSATHDGQLGTTNAVEEADAEILVEDPIALPATPPAADSQFHVDYPDLVSQLVENLETDLPTSSEHSQASQTSQTSHTSQTPKSPKSSENADPQRTPLERFRTYPRKPWSVTDLVSGAWCELQFEYTLTRLPGGRRTRTAAMQAGSKVHARLEEEVHTTVQVDVASREDLNGLKLWNMIQGLRTLRETGLTRELELWGLVDGHVVSGVIDMLSTERPSSGVDDAGSAGSAGNASTTGGAEPETTKITHFFPSSPTQSFRQKIYITDVKTRASTTLPSGPAARPATMQLLLYHRLLCDLASGKTDFLRVFARYHSDPDAPFTDGFLAQIGSVHDELFDESPSPSPSPSPGGETQPALVRYGTLRSLWKLLRSEVALTFPLGAGSVGDVVAVEYRLRPKTRRRTRRRARTRAQKAQKAAQEEARTEDDDDNDEDNDDDDDDYDPGGGLIGTNVIAADPVVLDTYLASYLQWWRGERPAKGVDIEEASLKCGYCEFAADCEWRSTLDQERVERVREKLRERLRQAPKFEG